MDNTTSAHQRMHRIRISQPLGLAAAAIALMFASSLAMGCARYITLPEPPPRTLHLLPTVGDNMAHWPGQLLLKKGDFVQLFLPTQAQAGLQATGNGEALVQLQEGDPRMNRAVRMLLEAPGYAWRRYLAQEAGDLRMDIAAGSQLKSIGITVSAPAPRIEYLRPSPLILAPGDTTPETARTFSEGTVLELTVPGEVGDGWSSNQSSHQALLLTDIAQARPGADGSPQTRLTFSSHYKGRDSQPLELVVKRGTGLIRESFYFHVRITPAPKC